MEIGKISEIEKRIAEFQNELKQALLEKEQFEAIEDENQRLAILLHEKHCRHNHTDGCGWFYEVERGEIHDWNRHAHQHWYEKASDYKAMVDRILKEAPQGISTYDAALVLTKHYPKYF